MELAPNNLLSIQIPEEIESWMKSHGNNHVHMTKEWIQNPLSIFSSDYKTVCMCLAYALRQENSKKVICLRLLGRARKLRRIHENNAYNELFNLYDLEDCLQ